MKILNCILFLTFLEFLYVKRAAGMMSGQSSDNSHTKAHLVMVDTTTFCKFYDSSIFLVPKNQPLDNPPSLRPKWMTMEQTSFPTYQIYIEMSHGRRYIAENLRGQHDKTHCLREDAMHYFWTAVVDIGNIRYESTYFELYKYNEPHPEIAENNPGGRIYFTIKGTQFIRYADLNFKKYISVL